MSGVNHSETMKLCSFLRIGKCLINVFMRVLKRIISLSKLNEILWLRWLLDDFFLLRIEYLESSLTIAS